MMVKTMRAWGLLTLGLLLAGCGTPDHLDPSLSPFAKLGKADTRMELSDAEGVVFARQSHHIPPSVKRDLDIVNTSLQHAKEGILTVDDKLGIGLYKEERAWSQWDIGYVVLYFSSVDFTKSGLDREIRGDEGGQTALVRCHRGDCFSFWGTRYRGTSDELEISFDPGYEQEAWEALVRIGRHYGAK